MVLKQVVVRLRAHAIQHRGLGLHEVAQCAGSPSRAPRQLTAGMLREGFGILLRCLYPACYPHLTHVLGRPFRS